jgi:hypothetical protein
MSGQQVKAPLDGVRVIDLGYHLAGPLAGMLLTDQGATTSTSTLQTAPLKNSVRVADCYARVQLRVKLGGKGRFATRPVVPDEQTLAGVGGRSLQCQKQTSQAWA